MSLIGIKQFCDKAIQNNAKYIIFESNCIKCTRYKDGRCSILRKSIEGRITDEVQDLVCSKYKLKK